LNTDERSLRATIKSAEKIISDQKALLSVARKELATLMCPVEVGDTVRVEPGEGRSLLRHHPDDRFKVTSIRPGRFDFEDYQLIGSKFTKAGKEGAYKNLIPRYGGRHIKVEE